ncbi:MAG TPA: lysophospholipid acyltransferase family protein [Sphingomonas sp.]|jgi:1-acyl-sn-glycerol-3-phosphate acyltransferase|nr:lysophospholipid acyltransferase family protein [Sphingomonas sp.]
MPHLRLTLRLLAIIAALLIALPLHGSWRLFGRPSPWPRRFLGIVARIAGARTTVLGRPLARDVVFVANHLSWIDILVIAGATGSAFVAKSDLRSVALIGWLCTLNHTIFVARGDRLGVAQQIASLRAALATDRPVTIFPEGTTGDGRTLLPFKAALLGALDPPPPGLRVQPVRVDYGAANDAVVWGETSGQAHALALLGRRGTFTATLAFAEAFDPADFGNRKAIAAQARSRVETLGQIEALALRRGPAPL